MEFCLLQNCPFLLAASQMTVEVFIEGRRVRVADLQEAGEHGLYVVAALRDLSSGRTGSSTWFSSAWEHPYICRLLPGQFARRPLLDSNWSPHFRWNRGRSRRSMAFYIRGWCNKKRALPRAPTVGLGCRRPRGPCRGRLGQPGAVSRTLPISADQPEVRRVFLLLQHSRSWLR